LTFGVSLMLTGGLSKAGKSPKKPKKSKKAKKTSPPAIEDESA